MLNFTIGFVISFAVTVAIIRYATLHRSFSGDTDFSGAQKFHSRPVPRIGGLGLMIALIGGCAFLGAVHAAQFRNVAFLTLSALPAFLAGGLEDVTKRVSPRSRLIATATAALLAIWLLDARIVRLDIPIVDSLLTFWGISAALTILAVAGLANAVNIIDGFNGLAGMVTTMMFVSLAYVSFQVGDTSVLTVALLMCGAILGFFLLNFPGGLVFLGDGGAYLIGFMLAELAVLLVMRNSAVSAWYPVLMFIYPIFETIFSIYRKKFIRGISPGIPDGVHLHMLIYKRVMRWAVGSRDERYLLRRNSMTSPYLWLLSLLAVLPATLFWRRTWLLAVCTLLFILTYVWLYWSIVRFKAPRWMIVKKKKRKNHHDQ
ncbi:MraY family glycosyltransferase [Ralstonia pickettii]|uniref:MraY family glycosyltransferase n=1 Tax=Ralstonia pickettii TaxID=329 RepID=UPI0015BE8237|nr:glycosyltransferase [Ralstonia pickettii]NWK43818.1 glycosyl transferase [Ralstonia pickettii]